MYNTGRRYNTGERYHIPLDLWQAPPWYTHLGHALPIVVDEQLRPLLLLHQAHDIFNHETLGGEDRLTFSLSHPAPLELTGALLDMAGKFYRVMVVSGVENEQAVRLVEVEAWARWHDLTKMPALPAHEWADVLAADILSWLLVGSGWTLGVVDIAARRHLRWGGGCNRLELLREIEQVYNGELVFDTANRTVSLVPGGGVDRGLFFLRGKNLRRVEVETNTIETVHRLYPRGFAGLTIESVNNGVPYIEVASPFDPPPSAILNASAFTDAAQLKHHAEQVFSGMLLPRVSYSCSIVDLSVLPEHQEEALRVGDVVTVYDEDAGVHIKTRVVSWRYDVEAPWQSDIELSVPRPTLAQGIPSVPPPVELPKEEEAKLPLILVGTPETDAPALGAELLSEQGWTLTGNWSGSWATGWTHTPGTWGDIEYVLSSGPVTGVLEYTVEGMTAGDVSIYFEDYDNSMTSPGTVSANINLRWSSNWLYIYASADFDGTIALSFRPHTSVATVPAIIGRTSQGGDVFEVRFPAAEGNTFIGVEAGMSNAAGINNTVLGNGALRSAVSGSDNVAIGTGALRANTEGRNTAVGADALRNNTTGSQNVAIGATAMLSNINGGMSVAIGARALERSTWGRNIAIGPMAMWDSSGGVGNVGVGLRVLSRNTNGMYNVAIGDDALNSNTTGLYNVAIGENSLSRSSTASHLVAVGTRSLFMNTTGANNTAVGSLALTSNSTGADNTAVGTDALRSNTMASSSTAVGARALMSYTHNWSFPNARNTAVGTDALRNTTSGFHNVAVGADALRNNTNGVGNVAIGTFAMQNNTSGSVSVAVGEGALQSVTTGSSNIAVGAQSLSGTTIGGGNIGIGDWALMSNNTGGGNIAIGTLSGHPGQIDWTNANPQESIFVGNFTVAQRDNQTNQIVIGHHATGNGSNTATIGNEQTTTTVLSPTVRLRAPRTPTSSTSPGVTGDVCWDANFIYVCISTNVWRRSSLGAW